MIKEIYELLEAVEKYDSVCINYHKEQVKDIRKFIAKKQLELPKDVFERICLDYLVEKTKHLCMTITLSSAIHHTSTVGVAADKFEAALKDTKYDEELYKERRKNK